MELETKNQEGNMVLFRKRGLGPNHANGFVGNCTSWNQDIVDL